MPRGPCSECQREEEGLEIKDGRKLGFCSLKSSLFSDVKRSCSQETQYGDRRVHSSQSIGDRIKVEDLYIKSPKVKRWCSQGEWPAG